MCGNAETHDSRDTQLLTKSTSTASARKREVRNDEPPNEKNAEFSVGFIEEFVTKSIKI